MKRLVLLLFILLSANLAYGQQRGRDGGHRATSVQRDSHGHSGGATVRDHGSSRSSGGHSGGAVRNHNGGSVRSGSHHSGGSISHSNPGRTSGGAVRSGGHHSGGSGHSSGHSASGAIRSGGHRSVGSVGGHVAGGQHAGGHVSHGSGHHGGQHSGHVGHGGHHVHHGGHGPRIGHRPHHVRYYPVRVRNYRRIRPLLHRDIIICINDWQPLWNGYYVRRYVDRIWICNAVGDRIVQGDEVILLPNGYYKVRNGDFWRVYDERGESIFNIWGEEVNLLDNGVFECYRAGMYFYYDELGNRLD